MLFLRKVLPSLPGISGSTLILLTWLTYGIVVGQSRPLGILQNFSAGIPFILLPAMAGMVSAYLCLKSPGAGGFLQLIIGGFGTYLWSQALLFVLVEKRDGLLATCLIQSGALLILAGGVLSLIRARRKSRI